MRYPENAPVPTWLKLKNKLPKIKKISMPKLAVYATVGLLCLAFYGVAVQPKINHDYYDQKQKETFARLHSTREERAQGLRPWSDPFDKK